MHEKKAQLAKFREQEKVEVSDSPQTEIDFGLAPQPTTHLTPQLLKGDMREQIKLIKDDSVQVVLTDPPYGIDAKRFNNSGGVTMPHDYLEENVEELHQTMISELDRICTKSAHVYIFCDFAYFFSIREMFSEEWRVRRAPLIWAKLAGRMSEGTPTGYRRTYECVLHATRGNRPSAKVQNDVIMIGDVLTKRHPAEKPQALYEIFLEMSGLPGDTVLDCFAGSGVIFRAAYKTKMKAIGIEIQPEYIELSEHAMGVR